jgi:hypothetical protein
MQFYNIRTGKTIESEYQPSDHDDYEPLGLPPFYSAPVGPPHSPPPHISPPPYTGQSYQPGNGIPSPALATAPVSIPAPQRYHQPVRRRRFFTLRNLLIAAVVVYLANKGYFGATAHSWVQPIVDAFEAALIFLLSTLASILQSFVRTRS